MENKFQIGDLIEVIGVESGWEDGIGKVGTIRNIYDNAWGNGHLYSVEFPERYYGHLHKCDGAVPSGNGWNFHPDRIRLVESVSDVNLNDLL